MKLNMSRATIIEINADDRCEQRLDRLPTRPGKPGKMTVHLENLETSWNFEKFNKYHGKMTQDLEKLGGY